MRMQKRFILWYVGMTAVLASYLAMDITSFAGSVNGKVEKENLLAPEAGVSPKRQYTPQRDIDILHLAIDVTPDFSKKSISAKTTIRFKPVVTPCQAVKLDAIDLRIQSITSPVKIREHHCSSQQLTITFDKPLISGQETEVTIEYTAYPHQGLYFRTPDMGYKTGEDHLFTQGEAILARHWYPCFDHPNEKFTSEIICRVPEGMTVLSNGRKIGEVKDPESGLVKFHWLQDKPHVNYLISLLAGYFKKVEDRYRNIPMAFYTLPSEIDQAWESFKDTKDMMAFFEKETGVQYPWDKYDQVCVNDFVAGGMENTSITTLTDSTLYATNTETLHSSVGLVAHELSHQWFGDLVTCKDWNHLWMNEGFATYYGNLYEGKKFGRDFFLYQLFQEANLIFDSSDDRHSIVDREYSHPDERFNYLSYQKGGWVLHMLRAQLGDTVYRKCVNDLLEKHRYEHVTTEDFIKIIEQQSGRYMDAFFDQWVYQARFPELDVNYNWDSLKKKAKISLRQTQKVTDRIPIYRFPLTIRFMGTFGTRDEKVTVSEAQQEWEFPLKEAPQQVRIDPQLELLAKINFNLPLPMVLAQLSNTNDVIGRILAIRQLAQRKDRDLFKQLEIRLEEDSFFAVRLEAVKVLASQKSDGAFNTLARAINQSDARVRKEITHYLGNYFSKSAKELLENRLHQETNPEIQSVILSQLGIYVDNSIRQTLLSSLSKSSYHNQISMGAIRGIKKQNDIAFIEPVMKFLTNNMSMLSKYHFEEACSALAHLSRTNEYQDKTREYFLNLLQNQNKNVRKAALGALGGLGDSKAIPVLEIFVSEPNEKNEIQKAQSALQQLRSTQKLPEEWSKVRQEVLELKNANQALKSELEEIKKRILTNAPVTTQVPKKKTKAPTLGTPKGH